MEHFENIDPSLPTSRLFEMAHRIMDKRWEIAKNWRELSAGDMAKADNLLSLQLRLILLEIDRRQLEMNSPHIFDYKPE